MLKECRSLEPSDIFLDSFGFKLTVERVVEIDSARPNPYSDPRVLIYFETEHGNRMHQTFRASRKVEVINA